MAAKIKILCTICARGGSKGVPGKNLRTIAGSPLIAHTVKQALCSGLFEDVAVSSDSDEIIDAAVAAGATLAIKRPEHLASDTAGKIPAILHAVNFAEAALTDKFDILVDLDATSPLRMVEDIKGAVLLAIESGASSVITGAPARRSPYFNLVELDENGHVQISKGMAGQVLRRQDAPECFDMNASIYVWQRDVFLGTPSVFYDDTRLYEMPEERSLDIDSELDFKMVQMMMEQDT